MVDSNALNIGPEELRCLLTLQHQHVEFMVVGGYAVRYHGHMRAAKDVDVLVDIADVLFGSKTVAADEKEESGGAQNLEKSPENLGAWNGGPCRSRTYDQEIKSLLLYQLS